MGNLFTVNVHDRCGTLNSFIGASCHDYQGTGLGAEVSSRDRGIDRKYVLLLSSLFDFLCKHWTATCMVNQSRPRLHVLENAHVSIEDHLFNIMWITQHHEEVISFLSNLMGLLELGTGFD